MSLESGNRLALELRFYDLHKHEWLREHAGDYVVVKGKDVAGFYSSFEAAYSAGVDAWGARTDFLVRQVLEHEPVFTVF